MRIFLYVVWLSLPTFFFLMALWGKLEQLGKSAQKHRPGDFLRQGLFVGACVALCILIDQYLIESIHESIAPDLIPLGFYQAILLPVVLTIAATLAGPSEVIRITKAPKVKYKSRKK